MKRIRSLLLAAMIAAPLLGAAAPRAAAQDIVDVAAGNKDFSTLVAAVKAAGLVDTLKGKGPFTVFAPTDDAFKKLPASTLETLLKPESKATLTSILTYHVLAGKYDAARITRPKARQYGIKSVEGSSVEVDLRKGVAVSGANVVKTDIAASNGVIHVIDTVILPPKVAKALAGKPAAKKH